MWKRPWLWRWMIWRYHLSIHTMIRAAWTAGMVGARVLESSFLLAKPGNRYVIMSNNPCMANFNLHVCLGVGFKDFLFSPRKLGKIPILTIIFFRWVGSTTNQMFFNILYTSLYIFIHLYTLYLRSTPHPVTITTRIITFLGSGIPT